MTVHGGTNGSAAHRANGSPSVSSAVFPVSLIEILADAEFCALTNLADRAAWAQAHGVTRPITRLLVKAARQALERKQFALALPGSLMQTTSKPSP